jgi:biotin-(acetyl-CoA carboxylase) ligase
MFRLRGSQETSGAVVIVDIDENGYLLMSVNGKLVKYSSGDLSLRVQN